MAERAIGYTILAHVKSKCDYFCESSHHVGFKSSLAHSLYMSEGCLPMSEIVSLFTIFSPHLSTTTRRQFCRIVSAVLAMTGGVTMRNISRWTKKGGSYRTIQRFFNTLLPWGTLCWVFFRAHLYDPDDIYLLAGDETVVPKSGAETCDLSRFFSSTVGKTIRGLAFFSVSIISVRKRRSYPMLMEQVVRGEPSTSRKKRLFQKLRQQKGNRAARKGARTETRRRSSSMTP